MPAFFSIIQYVPNPLTNERVNVGVLVLDEKSRIDAHFITNTNRLRLFAGANSVHALANFQKSVPKGMPIEALREISERWQNSIQLTSPNGSLLSAKQLMLDSIQKYLVDPRSQDVSTIRRGEVAATAKRDITKAMKKKFGPIGKHLVRKNERVEVGDDHYTFDVGIGNGTLQHLVQALSFHTPEGLRVERDVNNATLLIEKVQKASGKPVPVTLIVAEPDGSENEDLYGQAMRTFKSLNAGVTALADLPDWAASVAESFPAPTIH